MMDVSPATRSGSISELAETDMFGDGALALDFVGIVERLSDGDTITVRSGNRRLQVRLLGIDAPELHFRGQSQSPWAEAAFRHLRLLTPTGARVRLVTDRQSFDQYGRLLAYVLRGSQNVNLAMVRVGWAVPYQIYPNLTLLRLMEEACAAAQLGRRGIFDRRNPLTLLPYEFRQRVEGRPPTKFCGDTETRRYHPPQEYQRVPLARRVFFYSEADARAFGYAPAGNLAAPTSEIGDGRPLGGRARPMPVPWSLGVAYGSTEARPLQPMTGIFAQ